MKGAARENSGTLGGDFKTSSKFEAPVIYDWGSYKEPWKK